MSQLYTFSLNLKVGEVALVHCTVLTVGVNAVIYVGLGG